MELFEIMFLWQPAPPSGGLGSGSGMLFLLVAIVIMYFFMIRPQTKQRQKQQSFLGSLKRGQKVVTIGGVHGTITEVEDNLLTIVIAPKTNIKVQRDCISLDLTNAAYGGASDKK